MRQCHQSMQFDILVLQVFPHSSFLRHWHVLLPSTTHLANELERWFDILGVDGFNLAHVVDPCSFDDISRYLILGLQRHGRFRTSVYEEGATARGFSWDRRDWMNIPDLSSNGLLENRYQNIRDDVALLEMSLSLAVFSN